MPSRLKLAVVAALLVITSAIDARPRIVERTFVSPPPDVFSAANAGDVRTLHLELDLSVNFDTRRIRGSATHTIVNETETDRLVLDTRGLIIESVTVDDSLSTWELTDVSGMGQSLTIPIDPATRTVRIDYETTSTDGVVWLTPLQTLDDTSPFLYTFGQPIRTREWIPVQDTPGVRMTYDATVRVPEGLMALMSARNPTEVDPGGVYEFEMPYPIPPYLIALAVGRLEFRELDERTGFYAEPGDADAASWDLRYMPEMVHIAEGILGPYPFERYDFVLAPPGYSAGGMENPMLNFINVASVVSGDGEQTPVPSTLMAHELAHSWAGDLVTCATWSDTWLNEGSATYFSSRILEEMVGPDRAEIGYYWDRQNFEGYAAATSEYPHLQIMHRDFVPGDTPAVFNPTSYSKGSVFLKMLEDSLGRDSFDDINRSWFRRFGMRWADDQTFLGHLRAHVPGDAPLQLDEWIYGTGLPSNVTAPTSSALWNRIGVEASRFRSGVAASRLETEGWTSFEYGLFLWQITDLIPGRIAELDAAFGFSTMKNPSTHWFLGVAQTRYAPGMQMLERFLTRGSWNVISVYSRLAGTASGRQWARNFYEDARPHYVPGIQQNVDAILE